MREFRAINREVAKQFINEHHRHNAAPVSDRFRIGLYENDKLIGIGVAGNPIARKQADGNTIEITRVCVLDDQPNACSQIYARMKRIAQLMGYKRIITYTLDNESGSSLRAIIPELGEYRYRFHPFWYGDPYYKLTYLWGNFKLPMPLFTKSIMSYPSKGDWITSVGSGKRQKQIRSKTPAGLARAFFEANQ